MIDPAWAAIGTIAAAIASGIALYFSTRSKTSVDAQASITSAYKGLVDSLTAEIARQAATGKTCLERIGQLEATVSRQRHKIDRLEAHVWNLEEYMRAKGIDLPEFDHKPPSEIVIED